jgi:hypothetical protein
MGERPAARARGGRCWADTASPIRPGSTALRGSGTGAGRTVSAIRSFRPGTYGDGRPSCGGCRTCCSTRLSIPGSCAGSWKAPPAISLRQCAFRSSASTSTGSCQRQLLRTGGMTIARGHGGAWSSPSSERSIPWPGATATRWPHPAIIPDLIGMGLDILHPIQPEAMDVLPSSASSAGT